MKKVIAILTIAAASFATPGIAEIKQGESVESASQKNSILLAQYGPVHHAINNFGVWFWGTTAEIAIYECQQMTPVGGRCYYRGFW